MSTAASLPCTGSENEVQLVFLHQDWNCQYNIWNLLLYDWDISKFSSLLKFAIAPAWKNKPNLQVFQKLIYK